MRMWLILLLFLGIGLRCGAESKWVRTKIYVPSDETSFGIDLVDVLRLCNDEYDAYVVDPSESEVGRRILAVRTAEREWINRVVEIPSLTALSFINSEYAPIRDNLAGRGNPYLQVNGDVFAMDHLDNTRKSAAFVVHRFEDLVIVSTGVRARNYLLPITYRRRNSEGKARYLGLVDIRTSQLQEISAIPFSFSVPGWVDSSHIVLTEYTRHEGLWAVVGVKSGKLEASGKFADGPYNWIIVPGKLFVWRFDGPPQPLFDAGINR